MTFEMLLKAPLAISIRLFISPSHFPLSVMKCPRYVNFLTCSIALPSIVILALGVTFFLVTTVTLVFFILMLIPYSFHFSFTVFIRSCNFPESIDLSPNYVIPV